VSRERYKVVRFYQDEGVFPRVIKTGLTLEEAQAHCRDPETSSVTATDKTHEQEFGRWFDGYDSEGADR
jgi:hypothetical protein